MPRSPRARRVTSLGFRPGGVDEQRSDPLAGVVQAHDQRAHPHRRQRSLHELDRAGANRRRRGRREPVDQGTEVVVDHLPEPLDPAWRLGQDVGDLLGDHSLDRAIGDPLPPCLAEAALEQVAPVAEPLLVVLSHRLLELARDPREPPRGVPDLGRPPALLQQHGDVGEAAVERRCGH
jgi:hypothetical protein